MHASTIWSILLAIGLLASSGPAWAAAGQQWIVQDGEARAQIVIAEQPPRMAALAAGELQAYLARITGAELPIVTRPSSDWPLHIYVGKSEHTQRLGVTDEGLTDGAFRMVSGDGWLVLLGRDADFVPREPWARGHGDRPRATAQWDAITGSTWDLPGGGTAHRGYSPTMKLSAFDERGSLNAVYAFLRSLGVRWYMPGPLGEIVPQTQSIERPDIDAAVHPAFGLRAIHFVPFFIASPDDILWYLRMGLDHHSAAMGESTLHMHGMRDVYSRAEMKQAHPEYYGVWEGERQPERGRLCLSSPGLFDEHVRHIRMLFDHYDLPMASVFPADGYDLLCQCSKCQEQARPRQGWHGKHSDYVWAYANRVAAEVYKTHPDRLVSCIAYNTYRLPPQDIDTFSPNLVVGIHQWRLNFHDRANRQSFVNLREAWRDKLDGRKLLIWEGYPATRPGGSGHGIPHYMPHSIAEDLRSLDGISHGELVEVAVDPERSSGLHAPAFNHLNVYITARLYWNPQQDVDAMLDAYYTDFYGPARDEMKAFIEYCEANIMHLDKDVQRIDKVFALLAEARKTAPAGSPYAQRMDLLAEFIEPLKARREQAAHSRRDTPIAAIGAQEGASVVINGKLDEQAWQGASSFSLSELTSGAPPAFASTFRAFWSDDALYLAVVCQENDVQQRDLAATADDDTGIFNGDCLELLLETQAHSYYQIVISPGGAVMDIDRIHGINAAWSSQAQVATAFDDGQWTAEVRIPIVDAAAQPPDPLNHVLGNKPTQAQPWYFNVCRQRLRDEGNTFSAFSPTETTRFHEVDSFGKLYVEE